jgi:hypothetical protein
MQTFHHESGVRASGALAAALDRALERLRVTVGLDAAER